MNKADKHPDYKKMYSVVKKLFLKTEHFKHGPYDETFFTTRVYETAKEIVKHFPECSKEEILAAAVLHDVGKSKLDSDKLFKGCTTLGTADEEWCKHPALGVPIAEKIMKKLGHSPVFIKRVSFLIANHARRGGKMKDKPLDLQIIQDADLIADWGFSGFIRPFLYTGKFSHQSIFGAVDFSLHGWDPAKDKALINLDVSKKIANKKLKLQDELLKQLCKEIKSDLL
ncbi:MAG: HD domain-containing protein [Candidatus Woesearchaeota archaeon]|nr:HD domain-containing protein [Candidatus Woesearchaeota archaeon]